MPDKIKVLYYGDGPMVPTGFGTVAFNILNGLYKTEKYDITCLSINFWGDSHDQNHFKVYAMQGDPRGRDRIGNILRKEQPDILFAINDYDALTFLPDMLFKYKQEIKKGLVFCAYIPVDGTPVYPEFVEMVKRFIDYPVLYTKFGLDEFKKTDPNLELPYVYHGVDRTIFYPLEPDIRKKLRTDAGIDDKFVIQVVGANQIRKQFNLIMQAFATFAKNKDDVLLYLHTQPYLHYGWNLLQLRNLFGISDKVVFTRGLEGVSGINRIDMNQMYNIADLHLSASCGEGFGLCELEAASCGVPIIYHNIFSQAEWIGDYGFKIPTDHYYIFPFGDRGLIRPIPSVTKIVEALELFYKNRILLKEYSNKSIELANKDCFKWDNAVKLFDETFQKAMKPVVNEELELEEII